MAAISALFPFHENFQKKLKDFVTSSAADSIEDFDQKVTSNIKIKEEIHTLHEIQHVCIKNLKTMLYLEKADRLNPSQNTDSSGGLSERVRACCSIARILNDEVLDSMPDNFNALWNKVMLLNTTGNAADDIMDRLERVSEDTKVMLIAKAEVAGMYTYLEIELKSLKNSVDLYEEVLPQLGTVSGETPSDSLLDSLIVFWKQDLLWNYKLLTFKHEHEKALSEAENLVKDLDQSTIVNNKLKAKAWADLALIYEHHMPTYQHRWPVEKVKAPKKLMSRYFQKAMRLDPNNARIYMLAARELRKRAKGRSAQLQAIEWLEKSLEGEDVEDIRGFTLFHMGLANRQLWIDTDDPRYDVTVNAELKSKAYKYSHHPHFKARVIKPLNQPLELCLIPPPCKTPDKSVGWRFLNRIARDPNNTYLLKARRCLQEASETDEERCMFLIELTRTYISTGDIAEAHECLQRAQRDPGSDTASVDFFGVSLYENIAFLEESEMMRTTFNETKAEKIKSLYRESIRQSTKSDWQPVVGFHCLLALLYKQLETRADEYLPEVDQMIQQTDHMILQNEYFLLYMAMQKVEKRREIFKSFATDDFRIALMWRLIEMFNRRNEQYDAAAAFTYLSILAIAKKLTTEVKGINFTAIEKQRMLLQSAERVAQQRVMVAETRYLVPQYKELFDLCGADQEPESASGSASESLSADEKRKFDIVMKIIEPELRSCFLCRKERV